MRNKRKRSFTLMETALSFCVLAMILAFLFSTLRSSTTLSAKVDLARHHIFSRYHIHERLSQLFRKVEMCLNAELTDGKGPFYTELSNVRLPTLYFTFDNGIDPEEAFTGIVSGKLYLENMCLFLEISPLQDLNNNQKRRELLFNNVHSLSWCFYKRPSLLKTHTASPDLEKVDLWPSEYADIPYCMTLSMHLKDLTSIDYTFYLSSKIQPIHYEF